MGRPDECASLTRAGKCPSKIATTLGITTKSVILYIRTAVGFGVLRCSDVLIALDRTSCGKLPGMVASNPSISAKEARQRLCDGGGSLDQDEIDYYLELVASRSFVADLYYYISEVELFLHQKIGDALKVEFGDGDGGWWKTGVPERVRIDCATVREKDPEEPTHAYYYATLINLIDIIDKNWVVLSKAFLAAKNLEKQELLRELKRMNSLRNRVMHPIRYGVPNSEDIEFVREVYARIIGPRRVKNRWGDYETRIP